MKKWLLAILVVVGFSAGGYAQYCNSNFTNVTYEFLTNVTFAGINNSSGGTTGGPVNYTAQVANVTAGSSYPISISIDPDAYDHVFVFIDWDQNNVLNDAGEVYTIVTNASTIGPHLGSIAVPAGAAGGNTRMRVMLEYNFGGPSTNPCLSATYGESEDYTVNVTAPPCAGMPAGGTASAVASVCPNVNFTVTIAGAAIGTGLSYQWQSSPDGLVWTNIGGATSSSYTATQSVATSYRRRIICNAGPDTAYSTVASIAMTPFINCYCTPANLYGCGIDYISNVTLNTINNSSTCGGAFNDYTAMSTDLVAGLSYPMTVVTDGDDEGVGIWIDFNQNGLFEGSEQLYSSYQNAVPAYYNFTINIPNNALPGNTRMRVRNNYAVAVAAGEACTTLNYGEAEDYIVNILPPPADEAGVLAITKPEVATCSLGNQIWVTLQNLGTNPLTGATFVFNVNGLNIPTTPWSGSVAPQTTAEVQVPVSYALADGDSISVSVSLPNGQVEPPAFAFNNSVSRKVWAGLSGNKSVYGVGADYSDIPDALTDLYLRGVCDTVFFQIADGSYTTQHTFLSYPAAGPNKLAVFESASGNVADVDFTFTPTGAGDNFIFKFDGGDGYMIRNLTAQSIGATYATVIDIRNGANDIMFEGNTIVGDTVGTNVVGDFNRVVIASIQATTDHRTTLKNNNIIGGTRAIILAAGAGVYEEGHVLDGNTISHNTAMGALIGNVSNPVVKGNTFSNRSNVTGEAYNIIVNGSIDGATFHGNEMTTARNGANIYLINAKGGSSEFMVSNNFINSLDTVGLTRAILIENVASSGIVLANNSISHNSDNFSGGGVHVLDGSQIRLLNNNIGAFGAAPSVRLDKSYSISESDNNNLFGTNLANIVGTTYTTLAALQSSSGMDANSVNVNPGFNGTDLHTCTPELNGAAMPLAFVGSDIDGDVRGTTPDIGADEFVGDANGLLVEDDFLKCPADQVTIGNTALNGVTYSWSPSGNTSEITTTNAGTFVITATSSCGSFSDTAIVVNKPLPTASFTSVAVGLTGIFDNNSTNGTSYMWDFGDGNTSTEVSPSHVYSAAGTYSVSLTVTNDCGTATFGPTPVNVINAGIEENSNISVSLFPNPTNGQFTVTMSEVNGDATTISVIDVTGKTVMVKNIAAGVNQATLDATTFASGVYSVKIANGKFTKVIRLVRK